MNTECIAKEIELAKYQFTQETVDAYSCEVYNGMLDLDPSHPYLKSHKDCQSFCVDWFLMQNGINRKGIPRDLKPQFLWWVE